MWKNVKNNRITVNNNDQLISPPSILDGNEGNSLSTPSKSDNNNDINTNDFHQQNNLQRPQQSKRNHQQKQNQLNNSNYDIIFSQL